VVIDGFSGISPQKMRKRCYETWNSMHLPRKKQRKNWDLTNKIGGIGHQLPRNTELLFMGIDLMGSVAPLSNGGFMG